MMIQVIDYDDLSSYSKTVIGLDFPDPGVDVNEET